MTSARVFFLLPPSELAKWRVEILRAPHLLFFVVHKVMPLALGVLWAVGRVGSVLSYFRTRAPTTGGIGRLGP